MAEPSDEITIELDDEGVNGKIVESAAEPPVVVTKEEPVVEPPAAPVVAPLTDDPQAGIEALKRQIADANQRTESERQARMQAEQLARESAEQVRRESARASESEYATVTSSLDAATIEMDRLQTLKAAAYENGNYADVAKYDAQMGKTSARLVYLESAKAEIEASRARQPDPALQQQPQQTVAQQQDAFLAGLPPATADWIRSHPQFFSDNNFRQKAIAAAQYAETIKGYNHHNPEYFREIELATGLRQPEAAAMSEPTRAQTPAPAAAPAPKPQVAATPSRSTPGQENNPAQTNRITLTPQQREIARQLHPKTKPSDPDPEVVYAKNLIALIKEGKMTADGRVIG